MSPFSFSPTGAKTFLKLRGQSFLHAGRGVYVLLRSQTNARIHLAATLMVILAAILLDISSKDWCLLLVSMSMIWAAEAANTAVEFLADAVHPAENQLIRNAKDCAAAAVLISAAFAVVIGSIVFIPAISP